MATRKARTPPSSADAIGARYIESSALMAALLERDADALKSVRARRRRVTSALPDDVLARVGRPFPVEPVRGLDAVHLTTIEMLDDPRPPVTVVSRDVRVRLNAEGLGLPGRVAPLHLLPQWERAMLIARADHCSPDAA